MILVSLNWKSVFFCVGSKLSSCPPCADSSMDGFATLFTGGLKMLGFVLLLLSFVLDFMVLTNLSLLGLAMALLVFSLLDFRAKDLFRGVKLMNDLDSSFVVDLSVFLVCERSTTLPELDWAGWLATAAAEVVVVDFWDLIIPPISRLFPAFLSLLPRYTRPNLLFKLPDPQTHRWALPSS